MTATEREAFVKEFLDKWCMPVMQAKGGEYSRGEADVNSNFKRVAQDLGVAPEFAAWVYLRKHLDSIANFIKNPNTPLSEPIEGRLGDALNYILILASLIEEAKHVQ